MPRPVMAKDSPAGMIGASGLYDKHLAFDFLMRLDKTELDDRVHNGGKPNAAEFFIAVVDAADLVGQDAGDAAFLEDADEPHEVVEGGLFRPHAHAGGYGVEGDVIRLEGVDGPEGADEMVIRAHSFRQTGLDHKLGFEWPGRGQCRR